MNGKNMEPSHNNPYDLLYQLGVSANYKGFFHAAHAVTLCMQQERLLLVTKWLYPDVARHYGTNWKAVERNIRTAAAVAWERNRPLLKALAQRHLERCPRSTEFPALLFHAVQPKKVYNGRTEAAMKLMHDKTVFHPTLFWNLLTILSSYRLQMPVTEVMVFPDGNGYYVCPRCHITVEREFMSFCDRCGQHLGWKGYKKARKSILDSTAQYISKSF